MSSAWIKFYPSDWLSGTRGLNAVETGVYITLIATMYEGERPVPNEPKRLARQLGMTPAALDKTLKALLERGKIVLTEEGFWKNRVGKEIKIRSEKSEAAAQSASKRWSKTTEKQSSDDANAMPTQCERNATDDATRNQIPEERDKSLSKAHATKTVDAIWAKLPKRKRSLTSKAKLLKPVTQLLKAGHDAERILTAVSRCYSEPRHAEDDGQFAPAVYSWLVDGVWENYAAAEPAAETEDLTPDKWAAVFRLYCETSTWPPHAGPQPGQDGCRAPADLVAKYFDWVESRRLREAAA